MLESHSKSSRVLHQYQGQCQPRSPPIIVHLPHLCLIEAVRLRIVPEPSESPPEVRIGQTTFRESFMEHDSLVYAIRCSATTLTVVHDFACYRRVSVSIYGYDLSESPDKSQLIDLLNLSTWLRQRSLWSDVVYADLLCGLALIDSRSFLQASEILYSAVNLLEQKELGESICSRESLLLLSAAALFPTSKTERLVQMLGEISGQPLTMPDLHCSDKIEPLIEMVSPLLAHSFPYIRQAAARTLEFLLEMIGCDCVAVMETLVASLLMVHEPDLVEPVLQAIVTNLYLMAPDALQALMQDVFEPGLHQALIYSISDCSIATVLRLILGVFYRLKSDVEISNQLVLNVMRCCQDRYSDINWIVEHIWCHIITYIPQVKHQSEVLEMCAGHISAAGTTTCVTRSLQLIIRIAAVNLDKALDGRPVVQYGQSALIADLTATIMAELGRGDQVDLDRFRLYWQALILVVSLHNAITPTDHEHVSIDQIAAPIVNAAAQILIHASPRSPLLQVMRAVVPALEPSEGLLLLLKEILVWVPDCVHDDMFDLIEILIMKLRTVLRWEQIRDLVWVWCHRSTARSQWSNRCRCLIQQVVVQTDSLPFLFHDLVDVADPIWFRDLLQFISEIVSSVECIDLINILPYMKPIMVEDLHQCRQPCLHIIKQVVTKPQIHLDSAVIQAVLDCAEAGADPPAQFAISELIGILFGKRSWPWPIVQRSWICLQTWHYGTHWNNIRRMTSWAGLTLTTAHFSNANLDRAWLSGAQLWHEAIFEACQRRNCTEARLWSLKLLWALAFRSPAVLRSAPASVLELVHGMRSDFDADVRRAASLLYKIIDGWEGADPGSCEEILGPGSPPSSLTEMTVQVPDLRPGPLRSAATSPEREIDAGSDVSEDVEGQDLSDDRDDDDDDNDGLCQGEAMTNIKLSENVANIDRIPIPVRDKEMFKGEQRIDLDGEFPGQSNLLDLSLIELQWVDD